MPLSWCLLCKKECSVNEEHHGIGAHVRRCSLLSMCRTSALKRVVMMAAMAIGQSNRPRSRRRVFVLMRIVALPLVGTAHCPPLRGRSATAGQTPGVTSPSARMPLNIWWLGEKTSVGGWSSQVCARLTLATTRNNATDKAQKKVWPSAEDLHLPWSRFSSSQESALRLECVKIKNMDLDLNRRDAWRWCCDSV